MMGITRDRNLRFRNQNALAFPLLFIVKQKAERLYFCTFCKNCCNFWVFEVLRLKVLQ